MKTVLILALAVIALGARADVLLNVADALDQSRGRTERLFGKPQKRHEAMTDWSKSGWIWHANFEEEKTVQVCVTPPGNHRFDDLPGLADDFGFTRDRGWRIGTPFKEGVVDAAYLTHMDKGIYKLRATPGLAPGQWSPVNFFGSDSPGDKAKSAQGQEGPETRTAAGVGLEARSVAMGRSAARSWETTWGSYDESIYRARAVEVVLLASRGGDAKIEFYWIGSNPSNSKSTELLEPQIKEVTLHAGQKKAVEFEALFVENDVKYNALQTRERTGLKYFGWVARVVDNEGNTLAATGARPPMVDMVARMLRRNTLKITPPH